MSTAHLHQVFIIQERKKTSPINNRHCTHAFTGAVAEVGNSKAQTIKRRISGVGNFDNDKNVIDLSTVSDSIFTPTGLCLNLSRPVNFRQ
ncbi:hypothetical protein [Crateriforma spongiae]|uniref:hypothetical protein n=1 Tax=Crateriforma spongiae TaxID=2724528 RepID=UPI0014482A69|nr:hypothetical protein [Crateriforma spongiae]